MSANLHKTERICSFRLIDQIFNGGTSHSVAAYPLRLIFLPVEDGNKILISVPKRHFKHAVDRNHIKRQIREAYRHHKDIVGESNMAMVFIWMNNMHLPSSEVETKVVTLLQKMIASK